MRNVLLAIAIVIVSLMVSFRMPDRHSTGPVAVSVEGRLCNSGSSISEKHLNEGAVHWMG